MNTSIVFSGLLICALLTGCFGGGGGSHAYNNAAVPGGASADDLMRVGDKITIQLAGVPDDGWIHEFLIPPSGVVTVPLLSQSFPAAGHTVADLGAQIADAYKSQKIYSEPVVTVLPEERYVNVGGDVRGPSRVVYSSDSTVMSTINACGGFTDYADRRHVRILRGKQVIQVDCVLAAQSAGNDPPVYPGDQIYVPRTMF